MPLKRAMTKSKRMWGVNSQLVVETAIARAKAEVTWTPKPSAKPKGKRG